MKNTVRFLLVASIAWVAIFPVRAGDDVFDEISYSIRTANASELAGFFGNRIELTVKDDEDVYSKRQAEVIIREFFNESEPSGFEIIHKGSANNHAQYAIGSMESKSGDYRTYIFIKDNGEDYHIKELRFEKE